MDRHARVSQPASSLAGRTLLSAAASQAARAEAMLRASLLSLLTGRTQCHGATPRYTEEFARVMTIATSVP